jgi:hypothetical protein
MALELLAMKEVVMKARSLSGWGMVGMGQLIWGQWLGWIG